MSPQPRQSRSCMYYSSCADFCQHLVLRWQCMAWAAIHYFGLHTDYFLPSILLLFHFIFICFLFSYLLILALLVDVCEKHMGECCLAGWEGQQCDRPCNEKFYGQDCNSPCRCLNNAACNPQNGVCFIFLTFLFALFGWWHFWAVCNISQPRFGGASAS